jgi:hypothetical protein
LLCKGVAIIGSDEIPWISKEYSANPVATIDIVEKLSNTYSNIEKNVNDNLSNLIEYTDATRVIWEKIFK